MKKFWNDERGEGAVALLAMVLVCVIGAAALFGAWYLYKNVQVWGAEMSGRAVLAEAEFSRQVRIEEAKALNEAAKLEGQAELTRAEFSARSNLALAEGLGGSENYLRYLFIRMLEETDMSGQVIYIPTEAGMPILEANRLPQ